MVHHVSIAVQQAAIVVVVAQFLNLVCCVPDSEIPYL